MFNFGCARRLLGRENSQTYRRSNNNYNFIAMKMSYKYKCVKI